jgi:AcrR family transcriptional regulator
VQQIKEYSEKEKSIFNGIMDLLNQGYGIHELKVSDIAAAAGIGKGTVYEYFSTKEEIIRQAVSFYVYKEYEAFTALVSNQHKFEDVIYKILNHMVDMLKTRFSSLLFMVVSLGESDIKQLIREDRALFTEILSGMNEFIMELFKIGKQERLIGEYVTFEECRLVLNGILSSFTNEVIFMRNNSLIHGIEDSQELSLRDDFCQAPLIEESSLTELKERVVRVILKALG